MSNKEYFDVVIVGGGQAGITLSYFLQRKQVQHFMLEEDVPFSSWRKRWDGFQANTPNWMNTLPFMDPAAFPGNNPEGFATRDELVSYLEDCLKIVNPPIRTGVCVRKILKSQRDRWEVLTDDIVYETSNVAVCIGAMRTPKFPLAAARVPTDVPQIHSSNYKNPEQITTKSVLIVGSGSSGMQICRNLCFSKRFAKIHLAVSNVLVLPKTLLTIPIHRILHYLGLFGVKTNSLLGKLMYSTLEEKGDPILRPNPQDLAKSWGVHLLGKFKDVKDHLLYFSEGQTLKTDDLTIIWCTGFKKDFSLIETPVSGSIFDQTGTPIHERGIVQSAPGLYFVGLRYQYTVASHDLFGVGQDAMYIADMIQQRIKRGNL